MSIRSVFCVALVSAALPTGIVALSSKGEAVSQPAAIQNVIDARRGYKQFVLHNSSTLFQMAKGERDYDAQLASDLAGNLKGLTRLKTRSLWADGSDSDSNPGMTRALPNNWGNTAILDHHTAFRVAASDLADVAGGGIDALRTGIAPLEAACRTCHDSYRAKDF